MSKSITALEVFLTDRLNDGTAGRIRTVLVSPKLKKKLEQRGIFDQIEISGKLGNIVVTYYFAVLEHTEWEPAAPNNGFFVVTHTRSDYKALYLGHERKYFREDFESKRKSTHQKGKLVEVNPVRCQVKYQGKLIEFMTFEDAQALLEVDPETNLSLAVLNQPEIIWRGDLHAYKNNFPVGKVLAGCQPFTLLHSPQPDLGELFIENLSGQGWVISVKARASIGTVHSIHIHSPERRWEKFVRFALTYFQPEELWLAHDLHLPGFPDDNIAVEILRDLSPVPLWLAQSKTPEKLGLMEYDVQLGNWLVHAKDTAGVHHTFFIPQGECLYSST